MNIRVLGCSGGVGGSSGSTCYQLSDSVILDAGSGIEKLSLAEMRRIRHVVLTHAHIDHVSHLPTFLANLFDHAEYPIRIYGLQTTIDTVREHIFNWKIWPDFEVLPDERNPIIEFVPVKPGEKFRLNELELEPFAVSHTVPTVGYTVNDPSSGTRFVFTADTGYDAELVSYLNQLKDIDILVLECSFPDWHAELAETSGHLTPATVQNILSALDFNPREVWITHLKPSYEQELRNTLRSYQCKIL